MYNKSTNQRSGSVDLRTPFEILSKLKLQRKILHYSHKNFIVPTSSCLLIGINLYGGHRYVFSYFTFIE